jgi:hypothetical protein
MAHLHFLRLTAFETPCRNLKEWEFNHGESPARLFQGRQDACPTKPGYYTIPISEQLSKEQPVLK